MLSNRQEDQFRIHINLFFSSLKQYYKLPKEQINRLSSIPIILGSYGKMTPRSLYYEENKTIIDTLPSQTKNEIVSETQVHYGLNALKYQVELKGTNVQNLNFRQDLHFEFLFFNWRHKADLLHDPEEELAKFWFSESTIQFILNARSTNSEELKKIITHSLKTGVPPFPLGTSFISEVIYGSTIKYDFVDTENPSSGDPAIKFYDKYNENGLYSILYIKDTYSEIRLHKDSFYAALFQNTDGGSKLLALIWINLAVMKPLAIISGDPGRLPPWGRHIKERDFLQRVISSGRSELVLVFFQAREGTDFKGHTSYQYIKPEDKLILKDPYAFAFPVIPETRVRSFWQESGAFEKPDSTSWSHNIWLYQMIQLKFPDKIYKVDYPPKSYPFRRDRLLRQAIDGFKKSIAWEVEPLRKELLLIEVRKMEREEYIYLRQGMEFNILTSFDQAKNLKEWDKAKATHYKLIGLDGFNLIFYNPYKDPSNDLYRVIAINKDDFLIKESERRFYQNLAELLKPIDYMTLLMLLFLASVFAGPVISTHLKKIFTVSYLGTQVALKSLAELAKQQIAEHKMKILKLALGGVFMALIVKSDRMKLFLTGFLTGFVIDSFNKALSNFINPKNLNKLIPYYGWIKFTGMTFSTMRYLEKVSNELSQIDKATKLKITAELKTVIKNLIMIIVLLAGLMLYLKFENVIFDKVQRSKAKWQEARKKLIAKLAGFIRNNESLATDQKALEKIFLEIDEQIFQDFFQALDLDDPRESFGSILKVLKDKFLHLDQLDLEPIEEYEKYGRVVGKLAGMIYIKYKRLGKAKEELGLKRSFRQMFKDWFTPIFKPEKEMENSIRSYIDSGISIPNLIKGAFEVLLLVLKNYLNHFMEKLAREYEKEFQEIKTRLFNVYQILEKIELSDYDFVKESVEKMPEILTKILSTYIRTELPATSIPVNLEAGNIRSMNEIFDDKNNDIEEKLVILSLGLHLTVIASKMDNVFYSLDRTFTYGQGEQISINELFSILSFSKFSEKESLAKMAEDNMINMDPKELIEFLTNNQSNT